MVVNYEKLHVKLGHILVIFVQFGPMCLLTLLDTKIKICENGICILVFHFPLVLSFK